MKSISNFRAACAALAAVFGVVCWSTVSTRSKALAANPRWVQAPELTGTRNQWLNSGGKQVSLAARRGKVTIVEFFAFQSQDCRANLPAYKKWAKQWKSRGVEVVGVHTPELPEEYEPQNVASYVQESGIPFPVLLDTNGDNWKRWGQRNWPTVYVVDGDGHVRFQWEGELEQGNSKGTAQVERQVQAILAETAIPGKVVKTETQWKRELAPMTFEVLRNAETEEPFSGDLWNNHEKGTYLCAGCGLKLFSSDTKFESGTGWPSFFQTIRRGVVEEKTDTSMGMERIEVVCARCDGHLGHVFDDGPKPTGLRYCMNSAALAFQRAAR